MLTNCRSLSTKTEIVHEYNKSFQDVSLFKSDEGALNCLTSELETALYKSV